MKTLLRHINFILLLLVFSVTQGYGQVTGEYRSVASGNWTDPSSWEYYDGSAWVAATDYPGQLATNRAILIDAADVIFADSDITNSIGTLTINGQLALRDDTDNFMNTSLVIVDPVTGSILFDFKSNYNLPIDSAIQVTAGGLDGDCTNNNSIFFGPIEYAACSGQSDLGLEFDDITDAGGTGYATSNSPVCTGVNNKIVLYAIPPLNGGTYTYTWYDSPAPSALSVGSGQNLIIDAPLLTGQYSYLVKMESSESGGITLYVGTVVDVIAGVPTNITFDVTQSCGGSNATITVTSPLPSPGINYTVLGVNPFVDAVTNTTGVFSGLAAGTYALTVSNEASCASNPEVVVINPQLVKTWDGAAWSPVGTPTSSDLVTIDGDYSTLVYGDINACSLIVNSGFTLTIATGNFVIIQNDLTVDGTLDVLDGGSLVMVNDAGVVTNNGVTNVHRITTLFKKYDYTYWSTPVNSSVIASTFSGWNTGYAYEYLPANFEDLDSNGLDDDENDWSFASTMTPANGYIVMVPNPTAFNNPSEVIFSGKVNNGIQLVTGIIPDSSYLLGNPYPSALDADAFLNQNAGVIDGTLYFWTHNTAFN